MNITDNNLAFTLYNQSVFFPVKGFSPNTIVGSSVISASIGGVTDGTELPDPVLINFAMKRLVMLIIIFLNYYLNRILLIILSVFTGTLQLQVLLI